MSTSCTTAPAPHSKRRRTMSVSRRKFLTYGTTAATFGGTMLSRLEAAMRRRLQTPYPGKLQSRAPRRGVSSDPTLHRLVERTSFGFTRDAYAQAQALGFEGYREEQLDYESIDDSAVESMLAPYDTLPMTEQELYDSYSGNPTGTVGQLTDATMLRAIYSKRQLYERMVEFWTDHFNIDINDSFCYLLKTSDDRDVIRQYAMTSFPELLNASARSAAMSEYLDNYSNIKGHAQENYARELMELHTLGVFNGYTQFDVEQVARCLTGWTYIRRADLAILPLGTFVFVAEKHDNQEKTVLGQTIPAGGGESDGQAVLDMLSTHPNTAGFIARKMCIHFLGYDAPEDVIASVAATYLSTGGDIKQMLRVILQPATIQYLTTPKLKRPFHFIASLLRALDADVPIPSSVKSYLYIMGHLPFYWPQPDGYADKIEVWGTAVLPRWQFATAIAYNQFAPNISIDLDGLLTSEGGNTPGEQAAALDRILTGGQLTDEEVTLLQGFYDGAAGTYWPEADTLRLAASVPTFQLY